MTMSDFQNANRVLFVEGQDEKHVILHLCEAHGSFVVQRKPNNLYGVVKRLSDPEFVVTDFQGGVNHLIIAATDLINVSGRQVIGFVMDANGDLAARWSDLGNRLAQRGLQVPSSPDPGGTVIPEQANRPRIGFWLMPDNQTGGELEDFMLSMLKSDDPVWPLSACYIERIPSEARDFAPDKIMKAKFYAWLASRSEPQRMGAAIGACALNINTTGCKTFLDWLTKLFG